MHDASTSSMVPLVMRRLSRSARLVIRRQRLIRVSPLPSGRDRRPSPARSTPWRGLSDPRLRGGSEQPLHDTIITQRRGTS
jgi:hypothetical protein